MNSLLLKSEMTKRGMTQLNVAETIGISPSRFNAKLNSTGGAEFSLGEIKALKSLFGLSAEQVENIFLS